MPLCAHRLIIMAFDWVGPDLVFGGMTTLFIITGILSLRDAAAGKGRLMPGRSTHPHLSLYVLQQALKSS